MVYRYIALKLGKSRGIFLLNLLGNGSQIADKHRLLYKLITL